jgi:catechol 2,3-dioxygenase-like lactoylglutathione lyase family enzyme
MSKRNEFAARTATATLTCVLLACGVWGQQPTPERAHIFGIAGVRLYVSDIKESRKFYQGVTNTQRACDWCETQEPSAFRLPSGQFILLSYVRPYEGANMLAEVSFNADHLEELEKRFKENKVKYESDRRTGTLTMIRVKDPENHALAFLDVEAGKKYRAYLPKNTQDGSLNERIIHAGFVVKNREVMDKFYKDVLGFHVYWHGGMRDDETNWVDMQVPDGTDWVEYMLGVPDNADQRLLGVMNHFALGVANVKTAEGELEKAGVKMTEDPKIGRDGKWQLNLYDPDLTRIELMEFTPSQKPCCSDYTGNHPGPE